MARFGLSESAALMSAKGPRPLIGDDLDWLADVREPRLRHVLDVLPAAVYTTDSDGNITYFNEAAAQLWGCRPTLGSSQWCGSWRLYWPDGRPMRHEDCPMAIAVREGRPVRGAEAIAERPDGTRVPFVPYPTPLRDEAGRLVGAVNMLVDISERKRAEESQALLLRELAHRVKNTLAVIIAMARQTLRAAAEKDVSEGFIGRLQALARAHDVLFASDWSGAELGTLAREQIAPLAENAPERLTIEGPRLMLSPSHATALGLLLHELAANASKYGALSSDEGHVDLRWSVTGDNGSRHVVIDWAERDGPAVAQPEHKGLGSRLITQGVPGAKVDWRFESAGVHCTIDVPLH